MACFLAEPNDKTKGTSGGFKSLYEPKPQANFLFFNVLLYS